MSKGLQDSAEESKDHSSIAFRCDTLQKNLGRQLATIGTLDTKSSILVALAAATLALASSWIKTGISMWVTVAALVSIMSALIASLLAVYPSELNLYVRQKTLFDGDGNQIQNQHNVVKELSDFQNHNLDIINKKMTFIKCTIGFISLGYLLLGLAHIFRILEI